MKNLDAVVSTYIRDIPVVDIHTHLYSQDFGDLFLWGIDELLTYHYLIAEYFTYEKNITPDQFYKFDKKKQADLIWHKLFIENSPLSEATRGVVTVLKLLGIDTELKNLNSIRNYFKEIDLNSHIDNIFRIANIEYLIMTNNPFNKKEKDIWEKNGNSDKRFKSSLRIDDLLFDFPKVMNILKTESYDINSNLDSITIKSIRKFFDKWIKITQPLYLMCSLPPDFIYPMKESFTTQVIDKILIPILKEYNLPFALMFGVRRQINPSLLLAGDAVSKCNLDTIVNFVTLNPDINFLMTFLSRENIHETAVLARKFNNLKIFGCWWFTNIPSLIEEILKIRIELLGTNFIPQHSDARVLEQLIYKWTHFKEILKNVLVAKYESLLKNGWKITKEDIKNDIINLFKNRFTEFLK